MKKSILFSVLAITLLSLSLTVNTRADYKYIYHDHDEVIAMLEDMDSESSSKSDDVFSLQVIGHSYLNNPIYAVKFSDNPDMEEDSEPDVVIDSGIHADEWIAVESNINFIEYLFNAYYDDAHPDHMEVSDLINNFEIWILPMINPDGRLRDDPNGGDPENVWNDTSYHADDIQGWRMNVQTVECPERSNGKNIGIDLNRSWSRRFWEDSNCRLTIFSGGDRPFIATEAKVLKQFINNHMISLVFHQHSALNILFSNTTTIGLGSYMTDEMNSIYEQDGLLDPLLALKDEVELSGGNASAKQLKRYRAETSAASDDSEPACNGMWMTGQYYNWLWHKIDCPISSDDGSRRAIQCLFYEYPIAEEIYGSPEEGKIGKYMLGDNSDSQHPSSGEVVEWIIDRSIGMNKYLIKQSRYPFSPRNHEDMSRRPEAPESDLAITGAKISEKGEGLPGCFTYRESDARDMLSPGEKTITWNIQNNGTGTRAISSSIIICDTTGDPDCAEPFEKQLSAEDVGSDAIETFHLDYVFLPDRDYSLTINTGETNSYDNDEKIFVFSTSSSTGNCPVEFIAGLNSTTTEVLRKFRDDVLLKTPAGRHCVNLFYRYSPEIISVFIKNPDIMGAAQKALKEMMPSINNIIDNSNTLDSCQVPDSIFDLLDLIGSRAGSGLKHETGKIKNMLEKDPGSSFLTGH